MMLSQTLHVTISDSNRLSLCQTESRPKYGLICTRPKTQRRQMLMEKFVLKLLKFQKVFRIQNLSLKVMKDLKLKHHKQVKRPRMCKKINFRMRSKDHLRSKKNNQKHSHRIKHPFNRANLQFRILFQEILYLRLNEVIKEFRCLMNSRYPSNSLTGMKIHLRVVISSSIILPRRHHFNISLLKLMRPPKWIFFLTQVLQILLLLHHKPHFLKTYLGILEIWI